MSTGLAVTGTEKCIFSAKINLPVEEKPITHELLPPAETCSTKDTDLCVVTMQPLLKLSSMLTCSCWRMDLYKAPALWACIEVGQS